jgi:hypothetical protein|tara:strand:- start:1363 stop:1683 length:321 start_codon:yes stop_codon:yes gene_type:complete
MARYTNIPVFKKSNEYKTLKGKRYYGTTKYPNVPLNYEDTYVYAEIGDRFDQLAQQYYGDSSLWWIISIANNSLNQGSYFITPGIQLRIPSQVGSIISSYNELNEI